MLGARYGAPLPTFRPVVSGFPLALITPASDKRTTSTFGGLAANDATPVLEMHPSDAKARGLRDGAWVKVWNDLGEVHLPLAITDAIRPGVVCSGKGRLVQDQPQRPDRVGAGPVPQGRSLRRGVLQRCARGGGGALIYIWYRYTN